jgi:hypothetical protein
MIMPRYLMTYESDDRGPPSPEKMEAIAKFTEEMMRSGVVLDTGGILGLSSGGQVKQARGKFTVTDGPFPETKELIVGYAIVQVKNREEAIEQARRFMAIAGDGSGEIRQLMGPQDGPHH